MTNFTPRSGEGGWGAARADLTWTVERAAGAPAALFGAGIPPNPTRLLRWCDPDGPALVIGSAQTVPTDTLGLDVVRRRSGGTAVVVVPGDLVWADVVLPAGDPLWAEDVGVAPVWVGEAWAAALAELGVADLDVHRGAMVRTPESATWCFAGLGPGEVRAGGRKVVGISQRRTRSAALFQCAALLRWKPPIPELADAAVGIGGDADAVRAAVERHLP